jgi:hypothetical protein
MQQYGITIHAGKKTPIMELENYMKSVHFVRLRYIIVSQCKVPKKKTKEVIEWLENLGE